MLVLRALETMIATLFHCSAGYASASRSATCWLETSNSAPICSQQGWNPER